jgi:hypothetical protein
LARDDTAYGGFTIFADDIKPRQQLTGKQKASGEKVFTFAQDSMHIWEAIKARRSNF